MSAGPDLPPPEPRGDAPEVRREIPRALAPRLRDLFQVEALLANEQAQYRAALAAWRTAPEDSAVPAVPSSYRDAVARLQIALGHVATELEQLSSDDR